MKRGRRTDKVYGYLFICFTSRAVHIEYLSSLGTDAFIQGLRRFISNCGCPKEIYQATVTRKETEATETYIGLTENDFKRDTETTPHHSTTLNTETPRTQQAYLDPQRQNIEHFISWRILSSHSPCNSSSKRCNLFLKEKFPIICRPDYKYIYRYLREFAKR